MIDWADPKCQITPHFTVNDALWLPRWGRLANEQDGLDDSVKACLLRLFTQTEVVRSFLGSPLIVHCAFRPFAYNQLIGGANHSAHTLGEAVDFNPGNMTCAEAISKILDADMLEVWQMRMENNGENPTWIHLDMAPVIHSRYFAP